MTTLEGMASTLFMRVLAAVLSAVGFSLVIGGVFSSRDGVVNGPSIIQSDENAASAVSGCRFY